MTSDELALASPALLRIAALEWQVEPGVSRSLEGLADFGRYEGLPAQVALLADGRLVRLLAPVSYLQPNGTAWPVPADIEVNGASIPRLVWPLIGGPFEGRYRDASIVHDHYCAERTRSWRDTHRMFYEAMRCSGESVLKAKIMYYAVYRFGPRWDGAEATRALAPQPTESVTAERADTFAFDAEAIYVQNLALSEIEALADARNAPSRARAHESARTIRRDRSVERRASPISSAACAA